MHSLSKAKERVNARNVRLLRCYPISSAIKYSETQTECISSQTTLFFLLSMTGVS